MITCICAWCNAKIKWDSINKCWVSFDEDYNVLSMCEISRPDSPNHSPDLFVSTILVTTIQDVPDVKAKRSSGVVEDRQLVTSIT